MVDGPVPLLVKNQGIKQERMYEASRVVGPFECVAVNFGVPLTFDFNRKPLVIRRSTDEENAFSYDEQKSKMLQLGFGMEYHFRPDQFIVDDACADHFEVGAGFGGQRLLFHDLQYRPARLYASPLSSPPFDSFTIQRGLTITMQVRNTTDEPREFRAKFVGKELVYDEPVKEGSR